MKQRKSVARRRMNLVISEINNVLFQAGGRTINMQLRKEDEGLRLFVRGDFAPEKRTHIENVARTLHPAVRDPALVSTYGELTGNEQYTGDSELTLVGHMLDKAAVHIGDGDVRMELYLAY